MKIAILLRIGAVISFVLAAFLVFPGVPIGLALWCSASIAERSP
jgi:hypothetical protein